MYSVEQQALAQMVRAPDIAQDPGLAEDFRQHYLETEQQADLVRNRLEALGGSPSKIKDAIMKLGGKGFLLFAQTMPETPGRLITHAYSYEAFEWAGYEMLIRFAERVGDIDTTEVAKTIRDQERTMMRRLESRFDAAEDLSHTDVTGDELRDHVIKHLKEVHAFEEQNAKLLSKSEDIAENAVLSSLYHQQLQDIEDHKHQVERRLEELGADTSTIRDSALSLGGLNWSIFFQMQSDTPAKLAGFVYAVMYLQIGGYELLERTARRASDTVTAELCTRLLREKRAMAERLEDAFDTAAQATLAVLQA